MLDEKLKKHRLILASGSPRRQQYLKEMGLDFEIRLKSVEEVYPIELEAADIAEYLAKLKASVFLNELEANDILLTSDTIVWHNGESLAKAKDYSEACSMLHKLSGSWHKVITSVCFSSLKQQLVEHCITLVKFKKLSSAEIEYYVTHYKPFDKAGAYGIQEWIGLIGIEEIKGSYPNVVGLPTQLVYKMLGDMAE